MADIATTVLNDWHKSEQWKATIVQANALHDAAAKSGLAKAAASAAQLVITDTALLGRHVERDRRNPDGSA